MASDDAPGFLSKVARFVRNPLTNWGELDQGAADKESSYSKAALKEMIERKRRNDFIRRREFDQLRKLRSRGGMPDPESVERPSFFQSSSLPSTTNERAGTLRKIDEIEAQMSQQWWKSKSAAGSEEAKPSTSSETSSPPNAGAAPAAGARQPGAPAVPPSSAAMNAPVHADSLPATEPMPMNPAPEIEPWQRASQEPGDAEGGWERDAMSGEAGFVHDPDLEESAIRFANGDYEGAEAALLAQIVPGMPGIERAQTWLTLFDLYRATGQHDRFDSIAIDFANRFGRSAPVWFAMSESLLQAPSRATAPSPVRGFNWTAPDELQVKTLATLNAALATAPTPWRLNWSRIDSIDESAIDSLLQMAQRWCAQPLELRFVGAAQLMRLLADKTPVGDATVDPKHWRLRMEMLRLMGRADEFESVALDYCITYEISPPSWVAPRCAYQEIDQDGTVAMESKPEVATGDFGLSSLTATLHTMPGGIEPSQPPLELTGQLVGDASETLARLDRAAAGARTLAVRCDRLARVDFSAAGSVLNWVAARHADGCRIEFGNVQRLVAIFFNVIGINEYARVTVHQG